MSLVSRYGDAEIIVEKHKPTKFMWRIKICTQIIEEEYDLDSEDIAAQRAIKRLELINNDLQNLLYSSKAL